VAAVFAVTLSQAALCPAMCAARVCGGMQGGMNAPPCRAMAPGHAAQGPSRSCRHGDCSAQSAPLAAMLERERCPAFLTARPALSLSAAPPRDRASAVPAAIARAGLPPLRLAPGPSPSAASPLRI
jgi:hypothetical protein